MAKIRFIFFLLSVLPVAQLYSQELPVEDSLEVEDSAPIYDTTVFAPSGALDKYISVADTSNLEKMLSQNPTLALFKSMIVPGWGQASNGSYKRAFIYAGLDAWFIGAAIHYKKQAADFREQYDQSSILSQRNELYGLFNDRRDERNKYTWFAVIVTFVAMFDAYVDAHLSGFPSKEDRGLSLELDRTEDGTVLTKISLSF